jgi:hypothetical protein
MKTLLTFMVVITFFGGCSTKNAFEKFSFSKTRELSEDTILSEKIVKNQEIAGIASVVYLNKVLPDVYNDREYFYIYYYIKESDKKIEFLLNKKRPVATNKLPAQNQFTYLTHFEANWNNYYLVSFEKESKNRLNLDLISNKGATAHFVFIKDK